MKVAVSSSGREAASPVDPRFGRCPYFVFADTDLGTFEAVANQAVSSGHGAGVQAAQSLVQAGAEVVISQRFGPNAFQAVAAAGLGVYECGAVTVAEAVEAFRAGALTTVSGPTGPSHAGTRRS